MTGDGKQGDGKRRKYEQPPEVTKEDDKIFREIGDEMRQRREEREREQREKSGNR